MRDDLNLRGPARVAVVATWSALAAAAVQPGWALLLLAVATAMDRKLLRFLARSDGPALALAAVPLRWLFHLYSGAAFAAALVLHATGRGPHGATAGTTA